MEKMIRDEILADFEDKLNKEKFMENIHSGLQFQLIYVLDSIVHEELDKICKEWQLVPLKENFGGEK